MSNSNQTEGLTTSRIEALSDGVFAIAMTLLVLNLKVPTVSNLADLPKAVAALWPQAVAYFMSFMVIAVYWIGQHNQFHWIRRADRTLLWINVFFLMSISFVPFSASLLAAYPQAKIVVLVYGADVIASGIFLSIHWAYAYGKGKLIDREISRSAARTTQFRILIGIVFYVITTLLCFYSTTLSLVLFALLPFLYMLPSRLDKVLS